MMLMKESSKIEIRIPKELTPVNAINFSKYVDELLLYDEYVYNFEEMQHCHPFGLLCSASAIRRNIKKRADSKHTFINELKTQGGEFAACFGFYQSFGDNEGDIKEENDQGYRYIPIKRISAQNLHEEYQSDDVLNAKVDKHAYSLAHMLVFDKPQKVKDAVQYCFREMMRNAFEHSASNELWVCGQYWSSRNEAEIAILDEGIGIQKSLASNVRIHATNDEEANEMALQPGLSCALGTYQDPNDIWQNSGYGLYVASTLCAMSDGYFILSSGKSSIVLNKEGQKLYKSSQKGTAVCLNIRTNSRALLSFDNTLNKIVEEGQKKAQENGGQRILSASKITTIGSMIKHIQTSYENLQEVTSINHYDDLKKDIPFNEEVTFFANSINRKGEIIGSFSYNGKVYRGMLLNVCRFNRGLYLERKQPATVIVRKYKEDSGLFVVLEKYKYEKVVAKSQIIN